MQQEGQRKSTQGIHFLRLRGSDAERAWQHGRLLRREIHDGPLRALAKKNEWIIRRGPGLMRERLFHEPVVALYKNWLVPFLDRQIDEQSRVPIRALAKASEFPYELMRQAYFQPEALMLLSRISVMKHFFRELPLTRLGGGLPGCSSAVVKKQWSRSGRLLACRNMDYPIVGPWERHTTVFWHEPTEPGEIPHVAVGSAGIHTAGLTSMNREGLTLASHAHFGQRVSLKGKPILSIGDEIIRKARTIGEAVDIARRYKRHTYWTFVVSSARENDAVAIEMTSDQVRVRESEDGLLTHSNYFGTRELQGEECLLGGCYCEDLVARVCRLRQILEPLKGKIEPLHMAHALGDHFDPQTGEQRVFGNTVSVITTVQSVVFDPEAQTLWVSNRHESPVGLGDFVEIPVDRFWSNPDRPLGVIPAIQHDPELLTGVQDYREAYIAWHMDNHEPDYSERTLVALRRAVRAFPADGNLWIQAGIVAFKLRRFDEAWDYLNKSETHKVSPHSERVRQLYQARCMDIQGRRKEAKKIYGCWRFVEEPKLRRAYRSGLRKPYRPSYAGRIVVDLQFPDTFLY